MKNYAVQAMQIENRIMECKIYTRVNCTAGMVVNKMEILMILLVIIGVTVGVGSTLGIIATLIGTIVFKIYRRIRFGISLFN